MPVKGQDKTVLEITILSYRSAQRYAVRKTITAAHSDLSYEYPDLEFHISEDKFLQKNPGAPRF